MNFYSEEYRPKSKHSKSTEKQRFEDEFEKESADEDEFNLPGQHENPDEVSTRGPTAKGDASQGQRLDDANNDNEDPYN